jgi:glycosyltransferase involved in cell wall biosynthesis
MSERPIRVVALMESTTVSGPAKNLIEFARRAAQPEAGIPTVHFHLVTYTRGDTESEFVIAAKAAGIPTFQLVENRRFDTKVLPELKRILADCAPDILQSHNIKSHFYIRMLGLHRRYPWVVFNHGYTNIDWKDRLYTQFDRWSLRAAHRVVAVCGPFADRLKRRGVDPAIIRIQHNSVKPFDRPAEEQCRVVLRELNITNEASVLCVGRLSSEKGHMDLLEAIGLLARMPDLPPYRVVLVGDGPERHALEQAAQRLQIADRVVFAGHKTDMRPFYATASILALPSHTEGSPNVVLEAMAAALPVVATRVGGVPEIMIEDQTGFIVPPRNPQAMADGIRRMLLDPELRKRTGAAGYDRVRHDFTPEAYRRSLAGFYREIVDGRSPKALR